MKLKQNKIRYFDSNKKKLVNKSIEKQNNFENMKAHTKGKTKISTIKDHINNMQDSGIFISNQNLFSIKTPVIKNQKKNQPENIYNSYDESSLYSSKFIKEEHEFKLKSDKSKDSFQNVMIK